MLQVPAGRKLYGEIDRAVGHWRRYERDEIIAKLEAHGLAIEEARLFNLPGVVGWYVNSVLLKRQAVPGLQARLANWLVPWLRIEERWQPRTGMSLIAVGRKVREVCEATQPFAIIKDAPED